MTAATKSSPMSQNSFASAVASACSSEVLRTAVSITLRSTFPNRYLKDVDGNESDLYRLDLSLSYLFSQSENYRLSVSYVNGRTDDTLEETEYWKTQFGIRF